MGFNTIVFILNDQMHLLKESPKSVLFAISSPPMSDDPRELNSIRKQVESVARENNERMPHHIDVLPTFHADNLKFFLAGGNQISEAKPLRLGMTKAGKKTVTIELPDWFEPWNMFIPKPRNWPKRK